MTGDNKCYSGSHFRSDRQFNDVFPPSIRKFADRHWTPLSVARKVADYLSVKKGSKILDIGSGAGKFCLAAAHYKPEALFFGVEQRKNLVDEAEAAKASLGIDNAFFLHGNFMQTDFDLYDHFYFYNSFYENLIWGEKIDNTLEYSENLYRYYNRYLYKLLASRPDGTRLVTYHSVEDEVPADYQLVSSHLDGLLKCWIKISGLSQVDDEHDHPCHRSSYALPVQQEKIIKAVRSANSIPAIELACSDMLRDLIESGIADKEIYKFLGDVVTLLKTQNLQACASQTKTNILFAVEFFKRVLNAAAITNKYTNVQ